MIVTGLDPSLANTGAVKLVQDATSSLWSLKELNLFQNTVEPDDDIRKNEFDVMRARALWKSILDFTSDSDYICVEIPQTGGEHMQARSIWTSGIALGLIATLPAEKLICMTPRDLKQVAGKKDASKEEMCAWAYQLYPTGPWPQRKYKGAFEKLKSNHHICDALAAAVSGLQKKNLWTGAS
mgnify:CR=1 FL=1